MIALIAQTPPCPALHSIQPARSIATAASTPRTAHWVGTIGKTARVQCLRDAGPSPPLPVEETYTCFTMLAPTGGNWRTPILKISPAGATWRRCLGRGAADRGQYRQAAGGIAEAIDLQPRHDLQKWLRFRGRRCYVRRRVSVLWLAFGSS